MNKVAACAFTLCFPDSCENGAICEFFGPADAVNERIMVRVLQPLMLAVAHSNPLSLKRDNMNTE
jgi:hypothetical protein